MESSILSEILMFVALLSTFFVWFSLQRARRMQCIPNELYFYSYYYLLKNGPLVVICIWFTSEERIKASFE